jgi:hypothetical protein
VERVVERVAERVAQREEEASLPQQEVLAVAGCQYPAAARCQD